MAAAKGSRAGRDFTLLGLCFLEAAVSISVSKYTPPVKWRLFGLLISRGCLAFGPSFDQ
jgi:hypothetical protein